MRGGRRLGGLAVLLALAVPATADARGLYVALGDSFTAGALIPNQVGTPADCARSDHNYPTLTAAVHGYALRDASCSGAMVRHMAAPQSGLYAGGTNPPQLDAVTEEAELVTVGITANDTGVVALPNDCARSSASQPNGSACRASQQVDGHDVVRDRIAHVAPEVGALLRTIHRKAPAARVVVVGYPAFVPTDGSACYPSVPLSPDDLAYVNEMVLVGNAMLAEQASANDAEYVGTHRDTVGHHLCAPGDLRWFEGFVPNDLAYPVHPNGRGEAGMASSLIAALRRPQPAPAPTPVLSGLRRQGVARTTGTPPHVTLTLDRAATVRFTLAPNGTGFTRVLPAGTTRLALRRAVLGRRRGLRVLTATPEASGRTGAPVSLRFRMR